MSDVVKPETIIAEALAVELGWDWPEVPEERIPSSVEIVTDMAKVVVERLAAHGHTIVQKPDHTKPSPALIQAAYIAQDDLSKPPPQWAINAAAEIVDEYIRAQGNETVRVLGHPAAAVSATQEER